MKKRSLRKVLKRLGALTGAFMMAVSVISYGADLAPVPYSQRVYERYDRAVLEQAMAEFEAACLKEGQEEEVARLYDLLIREYDRLSTLTYMAQIAHDCDISDRAAVEEQIYTTDLYREMWEDVISTVQKGLDSSYHSLLSEKIGEGQVPIVEYYQPYTEEELNLVKEEDSLIRKYETLAAADTSVVINGESWSYDRLEEDTSLTGESYGEIQEALSRERNQLLGTCLLELADVRKRIANFYGYDSYSDYMYQVRYGRDYTMEDALKLGEVVKREIVPLYDDLWYADIDYTIYEELYKLEDHSVEEMLDAVQAGVSRVDGELEDRFRYLRENELYDIQEEEPGKDRVDTSYAVRMASYGDGYIFINRENTFRDYQALVHEFGHFSSFCYNSEPELYSTFMVDVMEIQSMGLELLVSSYAEEIAGVGGDAYAYETVTDMFYNVLNACMFNELETMLYEEPDIELEDLNHRFKEIQDEYEGWFYQVYDDVCYDWVDVPHIFYDPMYYIGYGTASLSAMDLWTLSQKDMEGAVNTYMGILKEGQGTPYRETAQRWGLRDIFDENQVAQLADEVRECYGLEEDFGNGDYSEEPGGEYGEALAGNGNQSMMAIGIMALAGIGTVIVLQVALLAVGGVIIWLLVKDKH